MSGFSTGSQRKAALAFSTIPVTGWLISCAIDADSCPAVARRFMLASSAMALRERTSASERRRCS